LNKPSKTIEQKLYTMLKKTIEKILESRSNLIENAQSNILSLIKTDNQFFKHDPLLMDWDSFRPLRLSREEDWSDWLVYVMEQVPELISRILNKNVFQNGAIIFFRELNLKDHRADIIIVNDETKEGVHIEVKLHDTHYSKTPETCKQIEDRFPEIKYWQHLLLIPPEYTNHAQIELEKHENIEIIDWYHVSQSLRALLSLTNDNALNASLIYILAGAIDQKILNLPKIGDNKKLSLYQAIHLQKNIKEFPLENDLLNDDFFYNNYANVFDFVKSYHEKLNDKIKQFMYEIDRENNFKSHLGNVLEYSLVQKKLSTNNKSIIINIGVKWSENNDQRPYLVCAIFVTGEKNIKTISSLQENLNLEKFRLFNFNNNNLPYFTFTNYRSDFSKENLAELYNEAKEIINKITQ
jgi:hypothetical protein